jgi:hypothetical protein
LFQFYAEVFGGVELSGNVYQYMREVGIDSPVSTFVCLCQSVARNFSANAAVVQLGLHHSQTSLDVPKTLAICYLSESHTEVLSVAAESSYPIVATVSANTFVELASWQEVYQL